MLLGKFAGKNKQPTSRVTALKIRKGITLS
jgi:hypothetical protein